MAGAHLPSSRFTCRALGAREWPWQQVTSGECDVASRNPEASLLPSSAGGGMLQVVKARALTSRFDAVVPRTTPLRLSFQGTTEPKRRATSPCALTREASVRQQGPSCLRPNTGDRSKVIDRRRTRYLPDASLTTCPGRRGPKRMQGLGERAFDGARGCGVTGVTVRGTS